MLVYQLDKPLEQLFLPADTFGTFHEKQAMSLVVDIQQETLDIILQDLLAETVVPVVIKVFNARSKPVDAPRALLRKGYARVGNGRRKGQGAPSLLETICARKRYMRW